MSERTTVVNVKNSGCDVYIGRPSRWGNPFSHLPGVRNTMLVTSRDEAVFRYKSHLLSQPDLMADLLELKGTRLGCYCAPLPCHGDVLAELADEL